MVGNSLGQHIRLVLEHRRSNQIVGVVARRGKPLRLLLLVLALQLEAVLLRLLEDRVAVGAVAQAPSLSGVL